MDAAVHKEIMDSITIYIPEDAPNPDRTQEWDDEWVDILEGISSRYWEVGVFNQHNCWKKEAAWDNGVRVPDVYIWWACLLI